MYFAIPSLIAVGVIWSLTGVVMSDAPRKKCDTAFLLLVSGILSALISLIFFLFLQKAELSLKVLLFTGGCYFTGSAINYCMLQFMSSAMQKGPNGVIWSFIQTALIFPFLTGVIFFGDKLTILRGTGLVVLLLALILLGLGKENKEKEKGWKKITFAAFIMAGVTLSLNSIPSYFPDARNLNSMGRTFISSCGTLFAAIFYCYPKYRNYTKEMFLTELKRPVLWKYIFTLKLFGLIASYLLLYPGLDAMAKAGAGCVSYPLVIGSCIASFNLYSIFILKEKWTCLQVAGTIFCIAGEVLII
ncbi:MAG: hypothetical protein IKA79_03635 [Lentisphaeria bacterium]|nr:hypothetical protein [Lentisphaeria bacterium]